MKLEIIEWDDAWFLEEKADISNLICEPYKTETVGWVVKENARGVVISPERHKNPTLQGEVNYPIFIPKKMITNRIVLKEEVEQEESGEG